MKSFCPFTKEDCRKDCVFSTHDTATDEGIVPCRIAVVVASADYLCDIIIKEKENT